ncbi:MAG: hypothetical protein ACJ768_03790 [Gaiellaceae bacterium]
MRKFIVLAGVAAAAAVVVSGAGAITAPPTSFTDATGDSGTAPDISTIAVTNDDHGLYTFTIGFATPYANNANIALLLDTDKNPSTGDQPAAGADYIFVDDYASHSFDLASWQSNDFVEAAHPTAGVVVSGDNKTVTMTINKSDLGGSTAFNFFLLVSDGTFDTGHTDDAPSDAGLFSYAQQTIFTLSAGASHNGAAKAGGTWTVSMSAVRSDTNASVGSEGTIACKATEGSKKLAVVSHSFVSSGGGGGSTAVCTFRVPKAPKHAAVHATVTVSDAGQSATKAFAAKTK